MAQGNGSTGATGVGAPIPASSAPGGTSRRRDPVTVERLRMLGAVARTGSIAAAGRTLGVTASAVSQQLSAFERDADVALLDRVGNRITLTAAGHALVDHAALVSDALDAASADLDRLRGSVGGPFRIASVTSAAATVVSSAVAALRSSCPELDVTVVDEEPVRSLDRLARGEVDLAVVDEYDHAPHPLADVLTGVELLREPLLVVVPPGWVPLSERVGTGPSGAPGAGPAAAAVPVAVGIQDRTSWRLLSLAELEHETWVLAPTEAACGAAVRAACRAIGFEPDVRWETDDILAHLSHVAAGHGVAVLPELAVRPGVAHVEVHALADPPLTRRLLAVTRTATVPRPAVAAVSAALLAAVPAR
ncbi:LysR family transcriptional regulator [Aquihabitans sp. G128]|uniref:LysR family transcriptional regulator n=1 Tax=Aquihabitans sp. G128 TaxID=2849779 RepID=UPI001C23968E|nr:LysR substrate-binding domain-containing protein [Aquihabitans sp. G128]QXC61012.1 LysR family transcriptional regulator [Aquihabitans sp. G128]